MRNKGPKNYGKNIGRKIIKIAGSIEKTSDSQRLLATAGLPGQVAFAHIPDGRRSEDAAFDDNHNDDDGKAKDAAGPTDVHH